MKRHRGNRSVYPAPYPPAGYSQRRVRVGQLTSWHDFRSFYFHDERLLRVNVDIG